MASPADLPSSYLTNPQVPGQFLMEPILAFGSTWKWICNPEKEEKEDPIALVAFRIVAIILSIAILLPIGIVCFIPGLLVKSGAYLCMDDEISPLQQPQPRNSGQAAALPLETDDESAQSAGSIFHFKLDPENPNKINVPQDGNCGFTALTTLTLLNGKKPSQQELNELILDIKTGALALRTTLAQKIKDPSAQVPRLLLLQSMVGHFTRMKEKYKEEIPTQVLKRDENLLDPRGLAELTKLEQKAKNVEKYLPYLNRLLSANDVLDGRDFTPEPDFIASREIYLQDMEEVERGGFRIGLLELQLLAQIMKLNLTICSDGVLPRPENEHYNFNYGNDPAKRFYLEFAGNHFSPLLAPPQAQNLAAAAPRIPVAPLPVIARAAAAAAAGAVAPPRLSGPAAAAARPLPLISAPFSSIYQREASPYGPIIRLTTKSPNPLYTNLIFAFQNNEATASRNFTYRSQTVEELFQKSGQLKRHIEKGANPTDLEVLRAFADENNVTIELYDKDKDSAIDPKLSFFRFGKDASTPIRLYRETANSYLIMLIDNVPGSKRLN